MEKRIVKKLNKKGRSHLSAKLSVENEYIRSFKEDSFSGLRVRVNDTEEYRIRIVSRGEQAFYQQNDRALLVEISPAKNALSSRSIRRWDDGSPVTANERDIIVQRMVAYLTRPGGMPIVVSDQ